MRPSSAVRWRRVTPAGSVAFSNQMVELVAFEGWPSVVATMFVPGEPGLDCEAGPLLYLHRLDPVSPGIR